MLWCRALVVALVLALVGTAIGDARGVVRDLIGLLSEAKTKEALKLLRGPSRQDLLEDPEQAREACAEAADYALDVSEEAADLEQAEELMDEFVKLGNELIAKHPESADAYRGVACSYLAHGRFKASLDEAEDEADWAKAAEHALQAGKLEHDAEHVVAASRYWRDAAIRLGSPPVVAHLDRASQIMKDAGKQFPGAGGCRGGLEQGHELPAGTQAGQEGRLPSPPREVEVQLPSDGRAVGLALEGATQQEHQLPDDHAHEVRPPGRHPDTPLPLQVVDELHGRSRRGGR